MAVSAKRPERGLVLLMTICGVAMCAAVWWYYAHQRAAIESAVANELAAIAGFKTAQIANWRHERIGDGRVLASTPVIRSAHRILSGRALATDQADVITAIARLSREFQYSDIVLADIDGSVRIRLNEERRSDDDLRQSRRRQFAQQAVKAGDAVLLDLTLDTRTGRPLMALAVPVETAGAFILEIDPRNFLYPYLQAWPTASRTGETVLGREDGPDYVLALNELRHAPGSALKLRIRPASAIPDDTRLRNGWFAKRRDYRDVPVLSVIRSVPDSPWYLAVNIDQAEVEAPLARLGWEMALIVGLIAVANITGARLIWRQRQMQALKDAEAQLRSANTSLAHELEERTRAEQEVHALTARLIDAQEEERTRLARELHDDISQQIAALGIGMSNLKRKVLDQPDAVGQSEHIQQKLVQLAQSTRRLSHELHPAALHHAGITAAMRNYCTELSSLTGHRISFQADGFCDGLAPSEALCVYRVAQEAMQNSIKHSKTNEMQVSLTCEGGEVRLVVSDRGVGMDAGAVAGLGLVSMRERARLVGGTVEVTSARGEGVTVTLKAPVRLERAAAEASG